MIKLIKKEEKYLGQRFSIIQKTYSNDDGKEYYRDIVSTLSAAVVLCITEDNEVVFVKQYREVIEEETLELPAGLIEEGEEPIVAAKRELEEETGYVANDLEELISFYTSCGYTNEKIYIFVARNFKIGKQQFDDDECIDEIVKIPLEKCYELAKQNYFNQASQNVAILSYYIKNK